MSALQVMGTVAVLFFAGGFTATWFVVSEYTFDDETLCR